MLHNFKPMLACDAHFEKIKFPCILQPKIDGVHSISQHAECFGRSLRPHDNFTTTVFFSDNVFHGICGEKTLGDDPTANDLCNLTSGALRRFSGNPDIYWWVFDYVTEETRSMGYSERMRVFEEKPYPTIPESKRAKIRIVPSTVVYNMEELLDLEAKYLDQGYEGIIIRDPNEKYKYGRCGKTHMGVWRVKRFIDAEFLIEEIIEGSKNCNELETDLLGNAKRSTHKENMQPNGQVGTLRGTLIADVVDPNSGKVILQKGTKIDVSPGNMTEEQCKYFFAHQDELLNKIGKFKLFPKGVKNKPRFPQFQGLRNSNDMS